MFFLTSETLKPHLFYLTEDHEMYHTVKTGSSTIAPDPPELFVATALQAAVFQIGSGGFLCARQAYDQGQQRCRPPLSVIAVSMLEAGRR